jgi:hypothetical protein
LLERADRDELNYPVARSNPDIPAAIDGDILRHTEASGAIALDAQTRRSDSKGVGACRVEPQQPIAVIFDDVKIVDAVNEAPAGSVQMLSICLVSFLSYPKGLDIAEGRARLAEGDGGDAGRVSLQAVRGEWAAEKPRRALVLYLRSAPWDEGRR